jgi:hypothetical protein
MLVLNQIESSEEMNSSIIKTKKAYALNYNKVSI